MIVVLDTNVLVSGMLTPEGTCAQILRGLTSSSFSAFACPAITIEYRDVLARPHIAIPQSDVDELLSCISIVDTPTWTTYGLSDPDDEVFLATALACGADILVTGNLRHFPPAHRRGVRVISPAEFLKYLKGHP